MGTYKKSCLDCLACKIKKMTYLTRETDKTEYHGYKAAVLRCASDCWTKWNGDEKVIKLGQFEACDKIIPRALFAEARHCPRFDSMDEEVPHVQRANPAINKAILRRPPGTLPVL